MASFAGNSTLARWGEQWLDEIQTFVERVDTPEARMLVERLGAGQSGEVEDRLALVVLAQHLESLEARLSELEQK